MRHGIRIGRISGINIYLDWSWIFIFLLVTFGLAGGVLFVWHPDWNPWLTWAVAVAASLLLFASVLLHELAHALVAKARFTDFTKASETEEICDGFQANLVRS
jgi:Zn-dependent protease